MYGIITKHNDIHLHLRTADGEYIWKNFGNTENAACHRTLPPLSQCPTNGPHASSALKPVEVTLAGLVTVSNEMCSCLIHKAGTGLLDGPQAPLRSFS